MSISKRDVKGRPFKSMGQHDEFLTRITKTLYYTKLPKTERFSLPVTELASDLFSEFQNGQSINLLYSDDVASISRNACVSPCSLVLALLYLERLKKCNIDYLRCVAPSKLFLISLMISSKYLHDDGEEDEVFTDEWAKSGDITVSELCQLEKEFLNAIDWNIFVYESSFWERLEKLEKEIALREGIKRGWFTYTELKYLLAGYDVPIIINSFVSFTAILAATYAAGILTLAASVFLTSRLPGTSLYIQSTPKSIENTDVFIDITEDKISELIAIDDISIPENLEENIKLNNTHKTHSPVTMLNTSLFIVSMLACNENTCNKTDDLQDDGSSWDWWNNPLMIWLSDISRSSDDDGKWIIPDNYYKNFAHDKLLDMSFVNQKIIQLEDKIHKATKVRLQEQIERSWHQEWTDTIYTTLGSLYTISIY